MRFLRELISVNTLILLAACLSIPFSYSALTQIFEGWDDLKYHSAVLSAKYLVTERLMDDSVEVVKLRMAGDERVYSVAKYSERVYNLLEVGDTLMFYTKPITSAYGNYVTDENRMWNTRDSNEVFHLTSNRYNESSEAIIDYRKHQKQLKMSFWLFPSATLLIFLWYFYRRGWLFRDSYLIRKNRL